MTAPAPTRLPPTAGFVNALRRLAIRLYGQRETDLQQQLGTAQELNQQLKEASHA